MEINFPNLGIYLDHVGKNISIFGFSIAYYGIVIVTGMMIAIWIAQREAKRTGQSPDMYVDFIIYALIFAIIGARLYYVIFSWDFYSAHPEKIFALREGGLAIYGGIIGGVVTAKGKGSISGCWRIRLHPALRLGRCWGVGGISSTEKRLAALRMVCLRCACR